MPHCVQAAGQEATYLTILATRVCVHRTITRIVLLELVSPVPHRATPALAIITHAPLVNPPFTMTVCTLHAIAPAPQLVTTLTQQQCLA